MKLVDEFPKIKFEFVEGLDEIPVEEKQLDELLLMDAVKGIVGVKIFMAKDLGIFTKSSRVSTHDVDLGMDLLLWRKLGKFKELRLRIIAIANEMEEEFAAGRVREIIANEL